MKLRKTINKTIQYILIFILSLAILLIALLCTMKIPKSAIEKNIKESAEYFKGKRMVYQIQKDREYTYLHFYSESVLLNIIYCVDTDDVIKSAMLDRYYESKVPNTNKDFVKVVEEDLEPTTQYLRYWHGSMIFLRPLLVFFSIQTLFVINYVIMSILFVIFLVILLKKSKKLALIYVISMIMLAYPIIGISIFYSWTFYIMIISSIIAIYLEKKGDSALFKLFFISGILTCFFDFLTTEIITLFVPVLIVLYLRKEERKTFKFKEGIIFVIKASIMWSIGYIAMWGAKWIIASLVLKTNAMEFVIDNLKLRINGADNEKMLKSMYSRVISANFYTLYPICNIKGHKRRIKVLIGIIVVFIALIDWKNIRKKKFSWLMIMIATIPYIRFIALVNHSYKHYFFTYREQIITIIALGMMVLESFNYKLWFKDIKMRKHIYHKKEKSI